MQEKALGQIKLYQNMETAYEEQRKRTHEFKIIWDVFRDCWRKEKWRMR